MSSHSGSPKLRMPAHQAALGIEKFVETGQLADSSFYCIGID